MTSESFAKDSGLKYVHDDQPGFRRRRAGKGFTYLDPQNARVSEEGTLHRIKSLVIPPAWEAVWICVHSNGHLQATGRDQRARKQYRYHPVWNQARNENKFEKLVEFGQKLPGIRRAVEKDLQRKGYPKEKILAAVVRVMELTRIRVGNDIYAEENNSYGLTTIRNDHTKVHGAKVEFRFRGKSGKPHEVDFYSPRLSRIILRCKGLPGEELFCYQDGEGGTHDIGSNDVNGYLHDLTGDSITAKDFRTWSGTVCAAETLQEMGPIEKGHTAKALLNRHREVIKATAAHLRNTVAVCRKYYVDPRILSADASGELHKQFKRLRNRQRHHSGPKRLGLSEVEQLVMEILNK